ncbi:hypothetical protein LCGC14_1558680 [marine sediment metagenome]|uniref:Uncharacterized protein n=1 Tax=marine sediment metagenome TaxID=412755 RepID=A0A0F9L4J4_9ZZZZ
MKELTVSKKQLESEVKKLEKKESYNKKALEISKTVISNLGLELESYKFYSYDQILELLADKMNIDMDYGLFLDVIEELEKEEFLSTDRVISFRE